MLPPGCFHARWVDLLLRLEHKLVTPQRVHEQVFAYVDERIAVHNRAACEDRVRQVDEHFVNAGQRRPSTDDHGDRSDGIDTVGLFPLVGVRPTPADGPDIGVVVQLILGEAEVAVVALAELLRAHAVDLAAVLMEFDMHVRVVDEHGAVLAACDAQHGVVARRLRVAVAVGEQVVAAAVRRGVGKKREPAGAHRTAGPG